MPSGPHEAAVALFRHSPTLAVGLLRDLAALRVRKRIGVRADAGDLGEPVPVELRADRVLIVGRDKPRAGIVVEPQGTIDGDKRFSWPAYAASFRLRLRVEVVVLVIALDRRVARWARRPIPTGGGNVFVPTVVGPDDIPKIVAVDEAFAAADRAVLSTVLHRNDAAAANIAHAAVLAADALGPEHLLAYVDIILAALDPARRRQLERLMQKDTQQPLSDFARHHFGLGRAEGRVEGRAEGRAEGKAETLLLILEERGLAVPDEVVERIRGCMDPAQLEDWVRTALSANDIEDVFGP